jgi:lysozyme
MDGDREARRPRRRVRWVLAGVGALIAVVGMGFALWWFWWVPGWRPPLEDGERYGVDVSAHQGDIEWREVAADDIEFVYIKATEGGDHVDETFATNWRGAGDAGLDRGAYHFFTLCRPGAEQAANFLAVAPPDPAALAPAVDLELAGNCDARPDEAAVRAELDAFLDAVESEWDRTVILYVGNDWESRYPVRDELGRPLWHRRFPFRPDVDGWIIWQLHGRARVDGIDGGVDLNVMRPG